MSCEFVSRCSDQSLTSSLDPSLTRFLTHFLTQFLTSLLLHFLSSSLPQIPTPSLSFHQTLNSSHQNIFSSSLIPSLAHSSLTHPRFLFTSLFSPHSLISAFPLTSLPHHLTLIPSPPHPLSPHFLTSLHPHFSSTPTSSYPHFLASFHSALI
jgi:hypothetical protein